MERCATEILGVCRVTLQKCVMQHEHIRLLQCSKSDKHTKALSFTPKHTFLQIHAKAFTENESQ